MRSSADVGASIKAGTTPTHLNYLRRLVVAVALLILVSLPAAALASDSSEAPSGPGSDSLPLSALKEAEAAQSSLAAQLTDAKAAAELPHSDLDRTEALQLLEGVFEPVLQSPAGDFDSLDVAKFLSDNAALVYPTAQESSGVTAGGEAAGPPEDTPALLETSVPLRVTGPDGGSEAVDLSLEQVEGRLQSAAPLEPVAIPQQLGAGIELPDAGIGIELVGAPQERAPSIIEESVAAYPNVDTDTDFAVAPTPTGVETLTTLRSADAPRTQTFHLDLPSGASLNETDLGAEVVRGDETLLMVLPASAIDATGADVPVSMTVSGDSLVVTVSPQVGTCYPILVDPLYEGFAWKTGATPGWAGWDPWTNNGTIIPGFGENWGAGWKGTYIEAQANYYGVGAQAGWTHTVPRLAQEEAKGTYPTSFIKSFSIQGLYYQTSPGLASPFLFGGIFNPVQQKWVTGTNGQEAVWSYPGNAYKAWGYTLNFDNGAPQPNGEPPKPDRRAFKAYGMSLAVSEPGSLTSPRASYLGAASVEILDDDRPTVATVAGPSGWVNQTAAGPIAAEVRDTGLGIKNVTFAIPGQGEKTIGNACGGQTQDPCPSEQTMSLPASAYSPAAMPQGHNSIPVRALDVLWNATVENALGHGMINVDHTAPTLTLSGTMTEQATLGTTRPQYTLKYSAGDGSVSAPQSGVTQSRIEG